MIVVKVLAIVLLVDIVVLVVVFSYDDGKQMVGWYFQLEHRSLPRAVMQQSEET